MHKYTNHEVDNKIIIKVSGGLGNQLFQYAVAKNLQIEKKYKIIADFNLYQNYFLHQAKIQKLFTEYATLKSYKSISHIPEKLLFLFGPFFEFINNSTIVKEKKNYQFIDFQSIKNKNLYLDGYWQNEKYFYKNKKDIKKNISIFLFKNKNKFIEKIFFQKKINQKFVMIHLRFKDYLSKANLSKHGQQNLNYYLKAINLMNILSKNNKFIIFTDDLQLAKKKFLFLKNKYFFECKKLQDPVSSMYYMSICDHFIIANSTYSWWSAYLSNSSEKIIICPKKWYAKNIFEKISIPKKWISI